MKHIAPPSYNYIIAYPLGYVNGFLQISYYFFILSFRLPAEIFSFYAIFCIEKKKKIFFCSTLTFQFFHITIFLSFQKGNL